MVGRRPWLAIVVVLAGCGHRDAREPTPGNRTGDDPPAPRAALAPLCGVAAPGFDVHAVDVFHISADGVTVQARGLPPGAAAMVVIAAEYGEVPADCDPRWRRRVVADRGGDATARFDLPTTDDCALSDSMVVRLQLEPTGADVGWCRFGTVPPP